MVSVDDIKPACYSEDFAGFPGEGGDECAYCGFAGKEACRYYIEFEEYRQERQQVRKREKMSWNVLNRLWYYLFRRR